MLYWQGGAGQIPLRLIVVAPTPYRAQEQQKSMIADRHSC